MKYLLGIDNGGTVTKAALFDLKGTEISVAARETPLKTPAEGFNERDMEELWQANAACIRQILSDGKIDAQDIVAVGCTGHGKGLYLWGKDGMPAYSGIASTDRRARYIVDRWNADGTAAISAQSTLQPVIACQPVALLRWLTENDPQVLENVEYIFECKDYIRFRLTGEAGAEVTDYSGTGLMNLKTKSFDRELMKVFGIEKMFGCLPPLKGSCERCGGISGEAAEQTGLIEGTPVCGGMFDIDACAAAMDVTRPEQLCVITGTWSINEYPACAPVRSDTTTHNSLFFTSGHYLIEESSPTSAGNLDWFINNFMSEKKAQAKKEGRRFYAEVDAAVAALPPQDSNVIFLPFLYGTNTGCDNAAFVGLSNSHGTAHLLRAIFEGVAFSHRMHIEKLLELRRRPESVRLAGGAANSGVWVQMFADILNMPVEVIGAKELGAKGCAMAAAVAAGLYPDTSAAAKEMVPVTRTVLPDPEKALIYGKKYARYVKLTKCLEDF